jgi:uncharacterized YccA/Bax inhibitor family protein
MNGQNFGNNGSSAPAMTLNPFLKKMEESKAADGEHATYAGVANKCFFFILMIGCGVLLSFMFHNMWPQTVESSDGISTTMVETVALFVSLILFIVSPIVASLKPKTVVPMGILFCAALGYFVTFFAIVIPNAQSIILYALTVTVALFIAVVLVFRSGKVQFVKKIGNIAIVAISVLFTAAFLVFAVSFIPQFHPALSVLTENPVMSISITIASVIIVIMFMMDDLGRIQYIVENKLPRENEWTASFGLIFSVAWLFLEVLSTFNNVNNANNSGNHF